MQQKLLTLLLFLFTCFIQHAQGTIDINTGLEVELETIFQNIDKTKIPYGLLKEAAYEFTELNEYDGNLTDSSFVHPGTLKQIYKTLLMSRMRDNVTSGFIQYQDFIDNWQNARAKNKIVLSGVYFKYSRYKSNAQNYVTISNNKVYDKYVSGNWQNPYETGEVFAISPSTVYHKGYDLKVKLPANLWYTNDGTNVQQVQIDLDDGQGYRNINFGQELSLSYTSSGVKTWKFKLIRSTGSALYGHTQIAIEEMPGLSLYNGSTPPLQLKGEQTMNRNHNNGLDTIHIQGTRNYLGKANGATLAIRYSGTVEEIRNPLIIVEGFDPGAVTSPEEIFGDNDLTDFILDVTESLSADLDNLINNDYDLIYVNWDKGTDVIQRNAYLLEEIIEWVNDEKVDNTIQNVILGQSMGGLVARYALKDMEDHNEDHDTRLYISHDSPHLGANVPLAYQAAARHARRQYIRSPYQLLAGELVVPLFNEGVSVNDYLNLIDEQAVKQMLYQWMETDYSINNTIHQQWQTELAGLGFPEDTRNISIANGDQCANNHGFLPSENLLSIDGQYRTSWLSDILSNTIGFTVQASIFSQLSLFTFNPGFLIGVLPGGNKLTADIKFNAAPSPGNTGRVYKGKITFTKKLLFFININVDLINKSVYAPASNYSLDYYPGGFYDTGVESSTGQSNNVFYNHNITVESNPAFGFVPVASALAVGEGTTTLNDLDYRRSYASGNTPTGQKNIPFHNYITSYDPVGFPVDFIIESNVVVDTILNRNDKHINLYLDNADWLSAELDTSVQPIEFNCSYICNATSAYTMNGPTAICGITGSYSVDTPTNAVVTWESSNNEAVTISASGNSASVSRVDNFRGDVDITATIILTGPCGDTEAITVSKTIVLGKPEMYPQGFSDPGFPPNPFFSLCQTYEWEEDNWIYLFAHGSQPDSDYEFESLSGNNFHWRNLEGNLLKIRPWQTGTISFRVRASNDCGWSDWKTYTYQVTDCSGGGGPFFAAYPNPSSDEITVTRTDSETDDTSTNKSFSKKSSSKVKITYEIINTEGYLVGKGEILNKEKIRVSKFAPGVYVLRLITEDLVETKQIIIN
ncbi:MULTISPECIES: T9SS type A sorting domain-containing protein [unclassified Leeuwenhoekiella]|uniref:T9SS type A sorting domain-containing protein n=1 Tax=unclassified Leeuwenhoekiella TaxID=2615029 RepID=UPI0025B95E54|nr:MULTISPECIES: T9SS type A sorting domain-containing protein [unclassified Leeuwenhoekiella]|tara:strand:+ start:16055 stop:19318 length:3264 start_codon:yes stop_codon:yes gene_type:complete